MDVTSGPMPLGWRECDISDLCVLQRGFDITEATKSEGSVPVYSSSGLAYFHDEARLKSPAVITGRKGLLGSVFLVREPCWPHDTTLWVKDFKGNEPEFVYWFLSDFRLERFDAATSVPTLNRNNLKAIPIRLPGRSEQRAIAVALGDVDALLASLDKLIAKKRDLKQAAMQQLLTGQTRLTGFSAKWEVKSIGSVIEALEAGVSVNSLDDDRPDYSHQPCILKTSAVVGGRFLPNECKTIAPRDLPRASTNPKRDTILISRMNTPELVGECGYVEKDYPRLYLPDRLWMTRFKTEGGTSPRWLACLLSTPEYRNRIRSAATGTSGSMKNIAKDALLALEISLPKPDEQNAISAVLSDMDAEITSLEARREKTQLLKQGMMQELLTGRTRLV